MLYDRHLMQPLFRLSIGNPGSSFAIEIARKIGLPEDVIAKASEKTGSDYIEMDKYLQDIVRDKRYWEQKRQNIRLQEKRLEELTARYEHELEAVNKQRKEILNTAKTQANQILTDTNAKIEQTIREIKEAQAEKEKTKVLRQSLSDFKNSMNDTLEQDATIAIQMERIRKRQERKKKKQPLNSEQASKHEKKPLSDKATLVVGDAVRLIGQRAIGTILERNDKQVVVAFGMIKSTVKAEQLEKVSKSLIKKETAKSTFISSQTADSMHEKKIHFKLDIDVRGMRGDEAHQAVTYFIDDAILVNAGRVRILHGTGTGALRQLIRNYLSTVPGIRHFQDEHVQFGGTGITVVDLE
jgi:DNA mismatch repair protein MutS2